MLHVSLNDPFAVSSAMEGKVIRYVETFSTGHAVTGMILHFLDGSKTYIGNTKHGRGGSELDLVYEGEEEDYG